MARNGSMQSGSTLARGVTLLIALFMLTGAAANPREQLRSNCRIIPQYVSGPGSWEDALNRWVSYFADTGKFTLSGVPTATTPAEFKKNMFDKFQEFQTFNHVYYVEEPQIHNDMCVFSMYHSFLAWDGKCGPLIRKSHVTMRLDALAKVTYYDEESDIQNVLELIESCKASQ